MNSSAPHIAAVALNVPLDKLFHYHIPPPLRGAILPGARVRVPFGRQGLLPGVCVELTTRSPLPLDRLKDVEGVLDREPLLDNRMLSLARWMAGYYACAWGEALAAVLPASVDADEDPGYTVYVQALRPPAELREHAAAAAKRAPRQARALRILADTPDEMAQSSLCRQAEVDSSVIAALEKAGHIRRRRVQTAVNPFDGLEVTRRQPPALTEDQKAALDRILPRVEARAFHTVLLHGVTGSGKTEVYLRVLEHTVRAARQGIVLVPEIALTPQTVRRFRERFDRVAVLHSGLTSRERRAQWLAIRSGKIDV
ncbi:MAG TPA: DEAD/DEAH box helicase, partial [Candidatus Brocadiia bacterium]|nr:DEAD/DEAH box helicase [Candidatus Brocadiia bacterium]